MDWGIKAEYLEETPEAQREAGIQMSRLGSVRETC